MTLNKKMAVFLQLGQEIAPISLSALLKKIDNSIAERSLRRWLSEMVKEDLIEKTGSKKGTKYQIIKNNGKIGKVAFSPESLRIINEVRRPVSGSFIF